MSDMDHTEQLRKMSTHQLLRWTAGWKVGCPQRLAGEQEIQRRRDHGANLRGWIAIGIAVLSLIISLLALLKK